MSAAATKTRHSAPSKTRSIIFTPEDEELLSSICKLYPLVAQHRIAQVCLRCGLRVISRDPQRLVDEAREASDHRGHAEVEGGDPE